MTCNNYYNSRAEQKKNSMSIHCKQKFPREFGCKTGLKAIFHRNEIVMNVDELMNLCKFQNFRDCFVSLYSFRELDERSWIRESVIIDTIVFDLDHTNLSIALKEAKKLVSFFLSKNSIPRVYFSGCKGFHVYLDFFPVDLMAPRESIKRIGMRLAEKLKLKTADYAVFDIARLIRIPLTVHSETGYKCTPITPLKFLKLDMSSLLHFCKYSHSDIEIHESKEFVKLLRYEDFRVSTNRNVNELIRPKLKSKKSIQKSDWREKRIKEYAEALRKYGKLTADERIRERHKGNEHYARLHLNCLMIESEYSDNEISEVFQMCADFNPQILEYQLKYNRRWVKNEKEKSKALEN